MASLILASASPRRKALLEQIGLSAEVCPADIDETPLAGESAVDYALRLAEEKSRVISQKFPAQLVLAADTVVHFDGHLLGKPVSKEDAFAMWERLSDNTHEVITSVAVCCEGVMKSRLSVSNVTFAPVTTQSMERYWKTEEPLDKAGAYAVQGYAAQWISYIEGSYSGIMGLPLFETAELLKEFDVNTAL